MFPNMNAFNNNLFLNPNQLNQFNNPNMINMNNNNNFLFQNLMNPMIPINPMFQMNPMIPMNPMMMQNMNNQININNNFNMTQSQKLLVDKIIEFYQKSERTYMNYNEPNQIRKLLNNLDTNNPLLKEGNDIDDPLHYVNEKKKLIKFINHDSKIFNVKVPASIDKITLYDIAELYKTIHFSQILLVYMNRILNKDENSINSISDGDFIVMIENIYYLDDTYLNLLDNKNNKNYNGNLINVQIKESRGAFRKNIVVPLGTKLSQIYKALTLHFGCEYRFICNNQKISEKNDRTCWEGIRIECYKYDVFSIHINTFGKKINIKIKFVSNQGNNYYMIHQVGIYNSTKQLINLVEGLSLKKVKKFYLGNKQINLEEEKSFISLGIKEDIDGKILFKENYN